MAEEKLDQDLEEDSEFKERFLCFRKCGWIGDYNEIAWTKCGDECCDIMTCPKCGAGVENEFY